jgi:hypothetical protein
VIFKKHNPTPERYTEDDLRKDVAVALQRARDAGRRAMSEPVI